MSPSNIGLNGAVNMFGGAAHSLLGDEDLFGMGKMLMVFLEIAFVIIGVFTELVLGTRCERSDVNPANLEGELRETFQRSSGSPPESETGSSAPESAPGSGTSTRVPALGVSGSVGHGASDD